MNHANSDIHCPSLDCGRAADDVASSSETLPGTGWRRALAALVSAPVRLHRYRAFHAEVVEDAIRAYDCSKVCRDKP